MYVCKQTFHVSRVLISQKAKGVIMRNLRYIIFYVKTKILTDFHICISAPLSRSAESTKYLQNAVSNILAHILKSNCLTSDVPSKLKIRQPVKVLKKIP